MKEMILDVKDEHYEEFIKFMEEYLAKGLVKIVNTTGNISVVIDDRP